MDLAKLRLELIDFNEKPRWHWFVRRVFIGFWLVFCCMYALAFFVLLLSPDLFRLMDTVVTDTVVTGTEVTDIEVPTFQITKTPLLVTATFGFLGSIFFIVRTFIRTVSKRDVPVAWYIARPLQGVLMSVFLYYAFRAGQLVFYSGGGSADETQINVWSISVLAILAGAFSEEAYDWLYTIAAGVFKTREG